MPFRIVVDFGNRKEYYPFATEYGANYICKGFTDSNLIAWVERVG